MNVDNQCQNPQCNNLTSPKKRVSQGYNASCSKECAGIVKQIKMKATLLKKYGVENSMHLRSTKDKLKNTNLEKYGVENAGQSVEVRQKMKTTLLEKYGVAHQMHLRSTKDKLKNTNLEKYGVENPSQAESIKQKKKETTLLNYGVDNPFLSEEIKDKIKQDNLEKYGVEYYQQTDEFKQKYQKTFLEKYNGIGNNRNTHSQFNDRLWLENEIKIRTPASIAKECNVTATTVYNRMKEYDIQPVSLYTSKYEEEIQQFLDDNNIIYYIKDRKLLKGKELDFFLPSHNIAIEFNGTYWHSELAGKKDKLYHLQKSQQCAEQGIQLVHIWEHDWAKNPDKFKSKLLSLLGKNNKIYARKTSVKEIPYVVAEKFLNENHIQNAVKTKHNYGLFHNDVLVAVMTFNKSRYSKKYEYELVRYCSTNYTNITGGASKLLAKFIKDCNPKTIVSYSDNSRNTGTMYEKLGFKKISNSAPSYHYTTDYVYFHNRVAFQKHKLKDKLDVFDGSKTEWENMQENGYDRIWDCGTSVWVRSIS